MLSDIIWAVKEDVMIRRMNFSMQSANRRRIRFSQLRSCLCPMCNNVLLFSNVKNAFVCQTEDCGYTEQKVELSDETKNVLL